MTDNKDILMSHGEFDEFLKKEISDLLEKSGQSGINDIKEAIQELLEKKLSEFNDIIAKVNAGVESYESVLCSLNGISNTLREVANYFDNNTVSHAFEDLSNKVDTIIKTISDSSHMVDPELTLKAIEKLASESQIEQQKTLKADLSDELNSVKNSLNDLSDLMKSVDANASNTRMEIDFLKNKCMALEDLSNKVDTIIKTISDSNHMVDPELTLKAIEKLASESQIEQQKTLKADLSDELNSVKSSLNDLYDLIKSVDASASEIWKQINFVKDKCNAMSTDISLIHKFTELHDSNSSKIDGIKEQLSELCEMRGKPRNHSLLYALLIINILSTFTALAILAGIL